MDSTKCEEKKNWKKVLVYVTILEDRLRTIFKNRWKSLYDEWNEDESNCDEKVESLIGILGLEIVKTINVVQMKALNSGKIKEWDLSTLSKILQKVKTPSNEQHDNENKSIQSFVAEILDNIMAHHPDKIISNEDFDQYSSKLDLLAFQFEISCLDPNDSSVIIEKYTNLKNEANELYKNDEFEKAIKLYSKALLLPNLSPEQMGILYSNRSICYLKLKNEEMTQLALSDAKSCEKLRPDWFKSHWRVAEAQKMLNNLPEAFTSYNTALGLEPTNKTLIQARDSCKITLFTKELKSEVNFHIDSSARSYDRCKRLVKYLKEIEEMDMDNMSEACFSYLIDDLEEAAINKGGPESYVILGHRHRAGVKAEQSYEKAVKFYKMAAQEGNVEALYSLALLTIKGQGCKANITEGFKMLEKAANDTTSPRLPNGAPAIGIAEAQCELGGAYEGGFGVPQSIQTAVLWYVKAAKNGCGIAATNLGCMYNDDIEIPRNEKLAVEYWKLAIAGPAIPFPEAMENLAVYYLDKGNAEEAVKYWNMRKNYGKNFTLEASSDEVFKKRIDLIKEIKKDFLERDTNTSQTESSQIETTSNEKLTPEEYFQLFEKLKRISVEQGTFSNLNTCKIDLEEIVTAVKNGSKFASELYEAMVHNYRALKTFEDKELYEITKQDWYTIITEFGQVYEITDSIMKQPVDGHFKSTILKFIRKILSKNEICELDKWARIYYVLLNVSSHVEMLAFLTDAIKKYPEVSRFYDLKLSMYGSKNDYKTGYEECEKYLKIFPQNINLLFFKAEALKHLILNSRLDKVDETIKAYEEFIIEAGPDHQKIPEAFYSIGLVHMDLEVISVNPSSCTLVKTKEFYKKGIEAEKLQLSMFLPYKSSSKEMLLIVLQLNSKSKSKRSKDIKDDQGQEPKRYLEYLSNPKRIQLIKKNRQNTQFIRIVEQVKMESNTSNSNSSQMDKTTTPPITEISQQSLESPNGLKEIHLSEMDQIKEKIYDGTMINLTVIDDPTLFSSSSSFIDVIVQDDLFDVQLLSVFNFDSSISSKDEIEKYFGFGCKFTLINPCMKIDEEGRTFLRVDDFKSIIFKNNEDVLSKKLCHYCFDENSKSSCSKCGKNYCSKECQNNDWKILKHKLICLK